MRITVRIWQRIVESLTRDPRGLNADGRSMGLGLATAMEKARRESATEVEEFLRRQANPARERTSF